MYYMPQNKSKDLSTQKTDCIIERREIEPTWMDGCTMFMEETSWHWKGTCPL